MRFAAFISYSHSGDARVAAAIQSGLQQFAKPWLKRRALNVFRDQTNLAASPGLWPSIERALQESEWFVLMASPESAGSHWVRQEIDWWLTHRSIERLIIVFTGGELTWDASRRDFDAEQSSALPPNLLGRFTDEPLFVDLRWARSQTELKLKSERFRASILDIATPLHGKAKDDIDAEDLRAHRRSRRLAFGGVAVLAGLTAGLAAIAYFAVGQRNLALSRIDSALAGRLAAQAGASQDKEPSLVERNTLLAIEAMRRKPSLEAAMALRAGISLLPVPVGRVLHARAPNAVSLSDDGGLLAVAALDGAPPTSQSVVLVIDTTSGAEVLRVPIAAEIARLAFSSTAKRLAILPRAGRRESPGPAAQGDIEIWDLEKKRLERRLPAEGPVIAMALSPDGRFLATGDQLGRAVVWEVASGQSRGSIRHRTPVHQVAFAAVPGQIVSGEWDGTLRVWNAATGRDVSRVSLAARFEQASVMAPDGSRIALLSDKGQIQLRRVDGATAPAVETIHHAVIMTLAPALSLNKTRIATAGRDNTARVWDLSTGQEEIRAPFDSQVVAVSLSGDGSMLAVGAYADRGMSIESLRYLDARRTQGVWVVHGWDRDRPPSSMTSSTWVFKVHRQDGAQFRHAQPIVSVGLSAKGEMLVTASGWSPIKAAADHSPEPPARSPIQSQVRIWDVRSGRELANAVLPGVTTSAAIASDQTTVAAIGNDGTLRVWALPRKLGRAGEARSLGSPSHVFDTGSRNARILFSADSSRIGILGMGGSVFDLRSANATFRAGPEQTTVGFDAAMTRVFVEGETPDRMDLRSSLLDTSSGRVVHQADSLHGNGRAMASDGRLAAAQNRSDGGGSSVGQLGLHISEISTAKRVVSMGVGHSRDITAMTFSPDGSHLATASFDETARIWDTSTGAEAARFANAGTVNAVAFSSDGRILAVGTEAGSAAVYFWKPEDLIAQACARLTRNLTELEWQQFLGEVEYRATCDDLPLDVRPR